MRVVGGRVVDNVSPTGLDAEHRPKLSVITPSLNHAQFLRSTIESVIAQDFQSVEHIVVDGGSTDGSIEILREYPHIRWISEPDSHINDAYEKAIKMARGDYIIQCCVSDGFLDKSWFETCVHTLEASPEVSLVWGIPQYMSEDGRLMQTSWPDFFDSPPPDGKDFLFFWLATGLVIPEGNYCVRRDVLESLFDKTIHSGAFREIWHVGFIYYFFTQGFMAKFLPQVANYGRTHANQRGQARWDIERPVVLHYFKLLAKYRRGLLSGRVRHVFYDAEGRVCGEIAGLSLRTWRLYLYNRMMYSRLLNTPIRLLAKKAWKYVLRLWNK